MLLAARPAVVNLQQPPVMPVDIVEDLPAHVNGDHSPAEVQAGGDTVGDHLDARWFSRGSGAPGALHGGLSFVGYNQVLELSFFSILLKSWTCL